MASPSHPGRLDEGQRAARLPSNVVSWLSTLNLEEELAAVQVPVNAEQSFPRTSQTPPAPAPGSPFSSTTSTPISRPTPVWSEHVQSSMTSPPFLCERTGEAYSTQRACPETYLEDWYEQLGALAGLPSSEANRSDILDHVATLHDWLDGHLFPHTRSLQTSNARLSQLYDAAEKDNDILSTEVGRLHQRYGSLAENNAREIEASREKTNLIGQMNERMDEITARFERRLSNVNTGLADPRRSRQKDQKVIRAITEVVGPKETEPDTDWEPDRRTWG